MDQEISTVIITLNEERCIRRAIESALSVSSEIVIIDSGSTDETIAIASSYPKVRILERKFDNYSAQRNYGIENCRSPWILMLDADEEVSTELQSSLCSQRLKRGEVYSIVRLNWFWGKEIKYAMGSDKQDRLFERNQDLQYVGDVHERLNSPKSRSSIHGTLIHRPNGGASRIFGKQNYYTELEISKGTVLEKSTAFICIKPLIRFLQVLIFRRGFLDGWRGLAWAYVTATYDAQVAVKVLEHRGSQ